MAAVAIPTHDAKGVEIERDEHGWRFWNLVRYGNGLRIRCKPCRREVELGGIGLVERFGRHCTLKTLRPHMVCSVCGSGDIDAYEIGMPSSGSHPGVKLDI